MEPGGGRELDELTKDYTDVKYLPYTSGFLIFNT